MQIDKIEVTYCTNYNGVNVLVNDNYSTDDCAGELHEKLRTLEVYIIDDLVDKTDEDGHYYGSEAFATNIISKHVSDLIGDECELVIKFDDVST